MNKTPTDPRRSAFEKADRRREDGNRKKKKIFATARGPSPRARSTTASRGQSRRTRVLVGLPLRGPIGHTSDVSSAHDPSPRRGSPSYSYVKKKFTLKEKAGENRCRRLFGEKPGPRSWDRTSDRARRGPTR